MRIVKYIQGVNRIAPYPTILNSLYNGRYDLKRKKFEIRESDFVAWLKTEEKSLTLILIVDVSSSTFPYINILKEVLKSLREHFRKKGDRIGLISLQGTSARILNHPTRNQNIVMRNLSSLKIQGDTPLADALLKAIHMVELERVRKPGSKPLVLLLSDCHPESITHRYKDIFEEPAYQDAIRTSCIYAKKKIPLVIINPEFTHKTPSQYSPGEKLSLLMTQKSGGKLIRLKEIRKPFISQKYPVPPRKEIENLVLEIEKIFGRASS